MGWIHNHIESTISTIMKKSPYFSNICTNLLFASDPFKFSLFLTHLYRFT